MENGNIRPIGTDDFSNYIWNINMGMLKINFLRSFETSITFQESLEGEN